MLDCRIKQTSIIRCMDNDMVMDKRKRNTEVIIAILTIVKFALPVVLSIRSVYLLHNPSYAISVLIETFIVWVILNTIAERNRWLSFVIGFVVLPILYLQSAVLCFCGEYAGLIMITNIGSIEALKGKAIIYGSIVIIIIIALFLPMRIIHFHNSKLLISTCIGLMGLYSVFVVLSGMIYSPFLNTAILAKNMINKYNTEIAIRALQDEELRIDPEEFYRESVGNGIDCPAEMSNNPNIILIFTEGLSLNVVTDSREIMPNVLYYYEHGLSFSNYYDHTAATYRGIIGQLYSSHQYNNTDTNSLISLQEILRNNGYTTTFINPEPDQELFSDYLSELRFDNLTSGNISDHILTDSEMYELMFETLEDGIATETPQFIVAYTFGTHVGNDSPGIVYGDGNSRVLNRFHYCDSVFGAFMNRLQESGYLKDTLVIFTTDHGSYTDDDYHLAFGDHVRFDSFCDTIPLFFYYEGIESEVIDAEGRNSIDLAPTILDYLDIDSPNYFLGGSLFEPSINNEYETVFLIPDSRIAVKTDEERLRYLTPEELISFYESLERYFRLANDSQSRVYQ